MPTSSVFACLPTFAPQCLLLNFDKQTCLPVIGPASFDDFKSTEIDLPVAREVSADEADLCEASESDTVLFQDGYSMLKNQVSAESLGHSLMRKAGVISSKYDGGFKMGECTVDLVNTMRREMKDGQLSFRGKRVLELGCGDGLPGIFAVLKGAATVHFQDFSEELLRNATIPNVLANLERARAKSLSIGGVVTKSGGLNPDVHYYAGDWSDVFELLSVVGPEDQSSSDSSSEEDTPHISHSDGGGGPLYPLRRKKSNSSRAFERALMDVQEGGYDIILMSETVYSLLSLPKLSALIKKCLRPPYGVLYIASKKHYYGIGGGARQFKADVDRDNTLGGHLVTDFPDNSSGSREVWKFFFR